MTRPKNHRHVCFQPGVTYFKPRGVPMSQLEEVVVNDDEIEALRLADSEGDSQVEAAKKMKVSQPTFARMLASARHKVAVAIIKGSAIRLGGKQSK